MVKKQTKKINISDINVAQIARDVSKKVKKEYSSGFNRQEVAPGSVSRQSPLEKEIGTKKYRERIHEHNKRNRDVHEKLPFTFPAKRKIRSNISVVLFCPKCDNALFCSEFTYGVICNKCRKYVKPINPEAESKEFHGIEG